MARIAGGRNAEFTIVICRQLRLNNFLGDDMHDTGLLPFRTRFHSAQPEKETRGKPHPDEPAVANAGPGWTHFLQHSW